mmetsp:Transcript_77913/g.252662  ORF Transcript_77913/g.252662 Transcript_77913/m.252662 type:complete len:200 (+) Transcript_77913:1858-2457(+)
MVVTPRALDSWPCPQATEHSPHSDQRAHLHSTGFGMWALKKPTIMAMNHQSNKNASRAAKPIRISFLCFTTTSFAVCTCFSTSSHSRLAALRMESMTPSIAPLPRLRDTTLWVPGLDAARKMESPRGGRAMMRTPSPIDLGEEPSAVSMGPLSVSLSVGSDVSGTNCSCGTPAVEPPAPMVGIGRPLMGNGTSRALPDP